MTVDLNDTELQRGPIPAGIYELEITVVPGNAGEGGFLRVGKKNMRRQLLELALSVVGGPYNKRKIWEYLTVGFDDTIDPDMPDLPQGEELENLHESVRIGRSRLRAILDSAYGLDPKDMTSDEARAKRTLQSYGQLQGLRFIGDIKIKPAANGYDAKNALSFVVTRNLSGYPGVPKQPTMPSSGNAVAVVPARRAIADELEDTIPF
jgi:hypothetical protein